MPRLIVDDPPKSPFLRGTLTLMPRLIFIVEDPPKSPFKRGTLSQFSPLFKGGHGVPSGDGGHGGDLKD